MTDERAERDPQPAPDREILEYIAALVDKESSGLTEEEQRHLQDLVENNPVYFGEYRKQLATKLCLLKHSSSERCPEETAEGIRRLLTHVYQSRIASL